MCGRSTLPDADELKEATEKVLAQNSLPAPVRASDEHVAEMGLKGHRIEHVFYIIKENRTYDQVLGDMPQGNGDPSLTIFGRILRRICMRWRGGLCCWTACIAAAKSAGMGELERAGDGQRVRLAECALQLFESGTQV